MKNKKKIMAIVILSILLVLIVGISYAYFTAKVEGNEDAKNINVEAAKMSVKLTGPTKITAEYLIPGESRSITFTVENTGTVPAIYNLDMIEVENDFDPISDLVYTVTSDNNGGHVKEKEAPTKDETLIRNILIQPETIQTYTLTILFKETKVNQNSNQNKTFEGRVQINNLEDKTMATRIIRNNLLQTNEPEFSHKSPEIVNEVETDYGKGMFAMEDDDGTSYYFRGAVENNNVHFAEMDWKILRINGDGSIRLILNGTTGEESNFNTSIFDINNVGYTYSNERHCTQEEPCISNYIDGGFTNEYNGYNSVMKTYLEKWYLNNLATNNDKIALTTYCNDTSHSFIESSNNDYYFEGYSRVEQNNSPSLHCPNPTELDSFETHSYGGVYKLKIGLITTDESNLMGYSSRGGAIGETHYLKNVNNICYWTMSARSSNLHGRADPVRVCSGGIGYYFNTTAYPVVPVINLKADVEFTTDGTGEPGTESNPYTID